MLETQLKQLIKSLDLSNELLTSLINNNSFGGENVQPTRDEPGDTKQPTSPGATPPAGGAPTVSDNNPDPSQPPGPIVDTVEAPAPVKPAIDPEIAASVAAAQSLQQRIMTVSQSTSNPMLGMQFLAQFKLSSFDQLSSEQMEQTDKQLVEIAAAAGVTL